MSSGSPTKSSQSRSIFSRNIRLNINSKIIPEDFFPESISQFSRKRKTSLNENTSDLIRKKSIGDQKSEENIESQKDNINFELLKKRLIKIKQSCPYQMDSNSKKKISFKRKLSSKQGIRKVVDNEKSKQKINNGERKQVKGHSKKLVDYMQKMKNVINIDIKFEEDSIKPIMQKYSKQVCKQNPEDVETDDSPKIERRRPKSEINSRQKLQNKQKIKCEINKVLPNPLKIKIRQVNKIMSRSVQSKTKQRNLKNQRYNQFIEIPLDQNGMLTFYGSPQKDKQSYDSKIYSARTSLPKLQK